MGISRRRFCETLAAAGALLPVLPRPSALAVPPPSVQMQTGSHVGNLYRFAQAQADRAPLELSFLRDEFTHLPQWQSRARAKLFELLLYDPARVAPEPALIRRTDRRDYVEEYLTFQTTPDLRVPAFVLVPKHAKLPAPAILALHSHDGIYLWGKEKIVENDQEHPYLTALKKRSYGGRSIAAELARQGYVVIAIDMFYWGERRMVLDDDPTEFRDRPPGITDQQINQFNQRASRDESLVARTLFTAGISWPGVVSWDDIRTVDYLVTRPDVDPARIGCVGLSVGGYRSFLLAALDTRIRVAVDVGWMTSFASQIRQHVIHTIGLSFYINGLARFMDLPDLAGLIAPRAVMVINGSQDRLFALDGVKAAFEKIGRCYAKAGAPDRQQCRLYDAPHQFNAEMQAEAWQWLRRWI